MATIGFRKTRLYYIRNIIILSYQVKAWYQSLREASTSHLVCKPTRQAILRMCQEGQSPFQHL